MRQFRRLKVPKTGHPIIRFIFHEMNEQRIGYADMADRSGVTRAAIAAWTHPTHSHSMRMCNLEAVLNVLGYKLTLVQTARRSFVESTLDIHTAP